MWVKRELSDKVEFRGTLDRCGGDGRDEKDCSRPIPGPARNAKLVSPKPGDAVSAYVGKLYAWGRRTSADQRL